MVTLNTQFTQISQSLPTIYRPTSPALPQLAAQIPRLPNDQVLIQQTPPPPIPPTLVPLNELVQDKVYLRFGDRGEAVEQVQERLNHWGFELEPDGIYGNDTIDAVKKFQRSHGLEQNGQVGYATLLALNTNKPDLDQFGKVSLNLIRSNQSYLQVGTEGQAVEDIQKLLRGRGYAIDIDGKFGPGTAKAVRQFQEDNNIQTNGFVGQTTLTALEAPRSRPDVSAIKNGTQLLKAGDKGPAVEYIQRRLVAWGYDVGVDGDFGPGTSATLRQFQSDYGLGRDGKVGQDTLRKLDQTPPPETQGTLRASGTGRKLADAAKRVANRRRTTGWCYAGVAEAVSRGMGVTLWGRSAYMAAGILAKSSRFTEVNVPAKDLKKLPAGAVVVWGKTAKSPHGHISVALGDGREASDHIDTQRTQLRGYTNVRVFLPK